MDDEKQYENVITNLKKLQKINAPQHFEADLMRKINSENYAEPKTGFWRDLLMPSKLIPSAAVAAILVILFIVKYDMPMPDDPLVAQPRLREDVVASSGSISAMDKMIYDEIKKNEAHSRTSRLRSNSDGYPVLTGSIIKRGLNFRQANITSSQRKEVIALKEKFELLLKKDENKTN